MFSALVLALFASIAEPSQVPSATSTRPTVAFVHYPATVRQPFVFSMQSHAATERIHAQLWARNAVENRWVCINYDLSHPVRRGVTVEECGVLLSKGQSRTVRYFLTAADLYLLRDLHCVANQRADLKIRIKSCTAWGVSYGESKTTRMSGL